MNEPAEQWLPVVGFQGFYEVSSTGLVRSLPRTYTKGRVLRPASLKYGHLHVDLWANGVGKTMFVHSMVAEAFLGPCPPGLQVRHLDGNARNNAVTNLAYGTASENAYDRTRHGTNHNAVKTHCDHGHAFDSANTIIRGNGFRQCRECHRKHSREWARRNRLRKQQSRE